MSVAAAAALPPEAPVRRWERLALLVLALVVVLLRVHTLREPLDCDEAAYGYVAYRLLRGDRLYVDVFENKPPMAYLPYAAAIAIGGYTERAIRWLPVPFCLVTLWAVWRAARLLGPPPIAMLAAALYAVLQADPHVFGNGANLEIYMNALLTCALWLGLRAWLKRPLSGPLLVTIGALLGAAAGIKQVAGLYAGYAMLTLVVLPVLRGAGWKAGLQGLGALCVGLVMPWLAMAGYCFFKGEIDAFWHAVFVYAPEVAREASASLYRTYAHAYWLSSFPSSASDGLSWPGSMVVQVPLGSATRINARLLVLAQWLLLGNPMANAWWGTVIWPVLLLAIRQALRAAVAPHRIPGSAFVAGWFAVTVAAIAWPGLFWQHYYMLLVPVVAVLAGRLVGELWLVPDPWRRLRRATADRWIAAALVLAVPALQAWRYAPLSPEAVTIQYKGGLQWVALRNLGYKLRKAFDPNTKLFVWGWQSPLHLYTGFDSVTPYFFTDPLMQAYVDRSHPLVNERKQRIITDLMAHRPGLIFVGERPFRELQRLLGNEYLPVNRLPLQERGLYVRIDLAIQVLRQRGPAVLPGPRPLSPWGMERE